MYVHISKHNFLACWETAVGRIYSLPLYEKWILSPFFATRLINENGDWFERELFLELLKPSGFNSRLNCAFTFPDISSAINACQHWPGFNASNLYEVEVLETENTISLDSNWLSDPLTSEYEDNKAWADAYWRGEAKDSQPITECLWSGIGRIVDRNIREECFNLVIDEYPNTLSYLVRSMYSFDNGANMAGLVKYRLAKDANDNFMIQVMDIREYLPATESQLTEYISSFDGIALPEKIDWNVGYFPKDQESLQFNPSENAVKFLSFSFANDDVPSV